MLLVREERDRAPSSLGVRETLFDTELAIRETGNITRRAAVFPTGGNSATATVTIPTSVQVGDLMLLAWSTALNTPGWTDPTGWTLLQSATGTSTNYGIRLFYRVAQSGDAGTVVTCTTPGATRQSASIVAYYNSTPFASVQVDNSAIVSSTATMPTCTTGAKAIAVGGAGVRNNGDETWTPPAGFTEVGESGTSTGTGGKSQTIAEILTPVTAGTNIGGGAFTPSVGTNLVAWSVSLKQVTVGAPPSGSGSGTFGWEGRAGRDLIADLDFPHVIAHRGGADEAPENTITAYDQLFASLPDTIGEIDLKTNQDGTLVLMHDTTVDRVAGGGATGNVTDYTDVEWSALTIVWPDPPGGTPVPASFWDETRDRYRGHVLMPEVATSGAANELADEVAAEPGLTWRIIGQAFNKTNATILADAGLRVVQLYGGTAPNLAEDATNGMWAVGLEKSDSDLTSTFVDDAHALGLKVFAYTVNSTTDRDALYAIGVDGVWSDRPTALSSSPPGEGAGTGTWTFTGSGTGQRTPKASGTGTFTFTGTGAGKRTPKGSGTGTVTFTGAATGKRNPVASGTGTFTFTGAGAGTTTRTSSGTGSWGFTGAAAGKRTPVATGTGTYTFTGTAAGTRTPKASGTGTFTFTGSGAGTAPGVGESTGTGTGSWGFTGTATGRRQPVATATGTWAFTGAAVGHTTRQGSGAGSYSFTGAGVGYVVPVGTGAGTWTFTGTGTGGQRVQYVLTASPPRPRRYVATPATRAPHVAAQSPSPPHSAGAPHRSNLTAGVPRA